MGLFSRKGLSELRLEAEKIKRRKVVEDKINRERNAKINEANRLREYIARNKYKNVRRVGSGAVKFGKGIRKFVRKSGFRMNQEVFR